MAELIINGVPTNKQSLNAWNSYITSVIAISGKGYAYAIGTGGFLAQFTKQSGTLTDAKLKFEYKNPNKEAFVGEIMFYDLEGKTTRCTLIFPTANKLTEMSYSIKVDVAIAQIAIEFRNTLQQTVNLACVSVDGTIKSDGTEAVKNEDFIKCAILFGTDANKPILR